MDISILLLVFHQVHPFTILQSIIYLNFLKV